MLSAFLLLVHLVAAVVWIGGMFFVHVALRPSLALLEPPARLALMAATLRRFFAWVVVAVFAVFATGASLAGAAGGGGRRLPVVLMALVAVVMAAIFGYIRLWPYTKLVAAVQASAWSEAGAALGTIRRLVGINLVLGFATLAVAVLGPAVS